MPKYLMEFKDSNASVLVEYDQLGLLTKFELSPGTFNEVQLQYLNKNFPKKQEHLDWYKTNVVKCKIKEVDEDLSFERFWNEFDYKVGNKSRALKLWTALPNPDKAKALKFMATYDTQLAMTKVNKMYPETYLHQQRWNN